MSQNIRYLDKIGVIPYAGTSFFTFETLKRKHFGRMIFIESLNPSIILYLILQI